MRPCVYVSVSQSGYYICTAIVEFKDKKRYFDIFPSVFRFLDGLGCTNEYESSRQQRVEASKHIFTPYIPHIFWVLVRDSDVRRPRSG